MKYQFFIFLAIIFSSCGEQAAVDKAPTNQHSNQVEEKTEVKSKDCLAIESVIQNYFDGWLTGDSTLVSSAMHSSCNLKYVRDGKIGRRDKNQYLSGFKPRPRLENAEGRILSIDITRTAAAAKIELETGTRLFTDYFNLLKDENRWYITDKVSTSISKEQE